MSAIIFVKLYINFDGYMSWSLVLNYLLTYLLVGSPYNTHIIPQYTIPKTKQIYKVVLWIKDYIYNCLAWFSNLQLLYLTIPQPPRIPNRSITCAMQSVRNRNFASYSNRVICLGKLWNLSTYGRIKYTMSIFLGCHKTRAYFLKKNFTVNLRTSQSSNSFNFFFNSSASNKRFAITKAMLFVFCCI